MSDGSCDISSRRRRHSLHLVFSFSCCHHAALCSPTHLLPLRHCRYPAPHPCFCCYPFITLALFLPANFKFRDLNIRCHICVRLALSRVSHPFSYQRSQHIFGWNVANSFSFVGNCNRFFSKKMSRHYIVTNKKPKNFFFHPGHLSPFCLCRWGVSTECL